MWETDQFLGTIDFHSIFFLLWNQWCQKQPGYKFSSKYLSLCLAEQRSVQRSVKSPSERTCFKRTLLVFLTASFSFLSTIKHGATLTSIYLRLELHNFSPEFSLILSGLCGCELWLRTHSSVSHVAMVGEQ